MKRGFLTAFILFAVMIVGFIASCAFGIMSKSWFVFLSCLSVTIFGICKLNAMLNESFRIGVDSWLASVAHCKYKYAWDGYGIAIDTEASKIHLISQKNRQSISNVYDLADVREWAYEMPGAKQITTSQVVGGGLRGATHNLSASFGEGLVNTAFIYDAMEKTGLYFKVRDIEYPVWFVKFKCKSSQDKQTEFELSQWMEILRQYINE